MNTISKPHKRLSERLNDPKVLTNPEEFLGPNYKAVLDFWLILDELTKDQWKTIESREMDFFHNYYSQWDKVTDDSIKASTETIGENFSDNAAWAAWDVYGIDAYYAAWATRELIGMHKILEDHQQPLTFFQMFLEVL